MGVVFAGCLLGCTDPTSVRAFPIDLESTVPLSASVTTEPTSPSGDAFRDATIRVQFDDYPDPDTVVYGGFVLESGANSFDMAIKEDLVGRSVLLKPRTLLQADTDYVLLVAHTVRALSGRAIKHDQVFNLHTGSDLAGAAAAPAKLTWLADIAPVLQGCSPFCHSPVDQSGNLRAPYRGLDFTADPTDPTYGVIGVPSIGSSEIGIPHERVAPNDSARSILLRKMLGGDHHDASFDPPYPEMQIDGRRMPLDLVLMQPALDPLGESFIAEVQSWIDQGAPIR